MTKSKWIQEINNDNRIVWKLRKNLSITIEARRRKDLDHIKEAWDISVKVHGNYIWDYPNSMTETVVVKGKQKAIIRIARYKKEIEKHSPYPTIRSNVKRRIGEYTYPDI